MSADLGTDAGTDRDLTRALFGSTDDTSFHAGLARLRQAGPIHRITMPDGVPVWLLTRYADVRAVLADPRFSTDTRHTARLREAAGVPPMDDDLFTYFASMLNTDPPEHTRLRRLVSHAFTARRVARLRPRIQQIADTLVERVIALGPPVDLIDEYAFRLPVTVICDMLGVPVGDQDSFRHWTRTMLEPTFDAESIARVQDAIRAEIDYLAELVAAKRAALGDDLISALIVARDQQERLTERELISTAFLLFVAGHVTTVSLISAGTFLLLTHPGQLAAVRADAGLLPSAVEEFLRLEGAAAGGEIRFATRDVEIAGVTVRAGEGVLPAIASADRDPQAFAGPDRLDITRGSTPHLAFGHGIHYCLGAPLARLEGEIAIGTLLHRLPDPALAVHPEDVEWNPGLLRGPVRLPVTFTPVRCRPGEVTWTGDG
jgi:cytochrome P450